MDGFSLNNKELVQTLGIIPPLLMIDYAEAIIPGESARGVKNLSDKEWFFKCHPSGLAMPGTLQTEAMLQTLVLAVYTMEGHKGKYSFITQINTKLISTVSINDQFVIHANLLSYRRGLAKGVVEGKVKDKTVCKGNYIFFSPHEAILPHK